MLPECSLFLAAAATFAGTGAMADTAAYRGAASELEVATPAVEQADIRVDGLLDDPVWARGAVLTSFTQFEPVEGIPATQKTEVRVIVDADAIYFGIKAYDDDPSGIRATLSERDGFTRSDDYVRIILDTFNDQRRAYVFTVNPLGVQHDGIWNASGSSGRRGHFGDPIDANPDFLWDSEGRITDWGYQVEVKIPFKSLRFPEVPEQSWGLQIERNIQRNGYKNSWAPITRNVSNRLEQTGKLNGLRNLDPGLFMELNPVLTGKRVGAYSAEAGGLVRDDPGADFGFNASYGITSNLTLDATYNPDFSQVEADAGQISVNERFALFFPEKRPFFLEGTEIFGMARQLVYTRTVANPIAGAKLTGKVGGVSLGYLGAVDEAFDASDPNTVVNLLRIRGDVGRSSTVGAVYTDRTVAGDDYNRVVGADARLQLGRRHTVTVLGATSLTRTPGSERRSAGRLLYTRVERAGRTFSFNAELEDTDADFRAGSGFFRRVGDTQFRSRVSYNWFGEPGALVQQVGPSLDLQGYWDHDEFWSGGGLKEGEIQMGWRVSFRDNITLWWNHKRSVFSFPAEAYEGLNVRRPDGTYAPFRPDQGLFENLPSTTVFLWVNKWERVRGNIRYTFSETPIFDRRYGVPVELADSRSGNLSLNLYPTRALAMEVGVRYTRLERKADGAEASNAWIPRVRAQYQFSRSLFLRGIFEYQSQEVAALRDPVTGLPLYGCTGEFCAARQGSVSHNVHVEALLSYEPSPGTVFYVGYTREMEDAERFRFRDVRPLADGLFVKLSYRFRM